MRGKLLMYHPPDAVCYTVVASASLQAINFFPAYLLMVTLQAADISIARAVMQSLTHGVACASSV